MPPWIRSRRLESRFPKSLRFSLLLFVLAIPFEAINLGFMTGSLSIAKITGALFFGMCVRFRPLCFPRPSRAVLWFSGYWLITVLYGFFIPPELVRSLVTQLVTIAQLILFLWVGSVLLSEESLVRAVLVTFLVSCSLLAVGNILELPGFVEAIGDKYSGYRFSALGYNLNEFAMLLGLALLIAIGLLLDRARWKRWKRTLLLGTTLPLLALIVRTGSRGGLLAFVVASTLYLVPLGRRGRRIVAIVLGVAALAGAGYMVVRDPMALERWNKTYEQGDTAGRDVIFASARNMIREKPILGWGPVEYLYELGSRTNHIQRDPHNLYLGLLAEVGIIGILPFLVGLWVCTRAAWQARVGNFAVMPLALQVMMLVANLSGTWITRKPMWFVMALALGVAASRTKIPGTIGRIGSSNRRPVLT